MKFRTGSDVNVNGTHMQGYVTTTYDRLRAIFGDPTHFFGDKTTVEWVIEFTDGTVATIYDWKEPYTPLGHYDWHVGGFSETAVERVQDALFTGALTTLHPTKVTG